MTSLFGATRNYEGRTYRLAASSIPYQTAIALKRKYQMQGRSVRVATSFTQLRGLHYAVYVR